MAPFSRGTKQAGLPRFQHLAVSTSVTPPQVNFTRQTCFSLCMLPVLLDQHTCFAGLVTWLLHQLSLAADQSQARQGAPMHFISELATNFELPCCVYACLSTRISQLPELWQTDRLHIRNCRYNLYAFGLKFVVPFWGGCGSQWSAPYDFFWLLLFCSIYSLSLHSEWVC